AQPQVTAKGLKILCSWQVFITGRCLAPICYRTPDFFAAFLPLRCEDTKNFYLIAYFLSRSKPYSPSDLVLCGYAIFPEGPKTRSFFTILCVLEPLVAIKKKNHTGAGTSNQRHPGPWSQIQTVSHPRSACSGAC